MCFVLVVTSITPVNTIKMYCVVCRPGCDKCVYMDAYSHMEAKTKNTN